jgi:two-component system OmpR family response regulator
MGREASMRVLIVEDDPRIRRLLRDAFEEGGAAIREAASIGEMRSRLRDGRPDLVTLDIGLPDGDGLAALRALRQEGDLPVILITGQNDTADVVRGLEIGADDYVVKPFDTMEVVARARAVHRRHANGRGNLFATLFFEGWTVDLTRRTLLRPDGRPVELTAAQFALLQALVTRQNALCTRDELRIAIGRPAGGYEDRALDMQIRRLRARIEPEPDVPRFIKTIRGKGYVFSVPVTVVDPK